MSRGMLAPRACPPPLAAARVHGSVPLTWVAAGEPQSIPDASEPSPGFHPHLVPTGHREPPGSDVLFWGGSTHQARGAGLSITEGAQMQTAESSAAVRGACGG